VGHISLPITEGQGKAIQIIEMPIPFPRSPLIKLSFFPSILLFSPVDIPFSLWTVYAGGSFLWFMFGGGTKEKLNHLVLGFLLIQAEIEPVRPKLNPLFILYMLERNDDFYSLLALTLRGKLINNKNIQNSS
jgi:hypothetical protein